MSNNAEKRREGPNKLLDIQLRKLDEEGTVAIVVLDTDHGRVDFVINRGLAEFVRDEMIDFLNGRAEAFQP